MSCHSYVQLLYSCCPLPLMDSALMTTSELIDNPSKQNLNYWALHSYNYSSSFSPSQASHAYTQSSQIQPRQIVDDCYRAHPVRPACARAHGDTCSLLGSSCVQSVSSNTVCVSFMLPVSLLVRFSLPLLVTLCYFLNQFSFMLFLFVSFRWLPSSHRSLTVMLRFI